MNILRRAYFSKPFIPCKLLCGLALFFFNGQLLADTIPENKYSSYLDMDIEELMSIEIYVPAALTHMSQAETPASITTISSEMIKSTPARNLYDLLEIYVPGAFWVNHEEGPHMGFRGIIVNRNISYLLLVNGRNMNNKARYGAKSELENWNLADIHKIEIIRGSGSVTYGPGAVGGIINIITNQAKDQTGFQAIASYNTPYNSKSANLSYGLQKDKIDFYAFGSIVSTDGIPAEHYLITDDNTFGKVGDNVKTDEQPMDYFADYRGVPQIKTHFDITFKNSIRLWARYTQQGSNWLGNETKTEYNGRYINQQGIQDRQFTTTLDYFKNLSVRVDLSIMLSFDSYDCERTGSNDRDTTYAFHPLNKKADFAEYELFGRSQINWKIIDAIEVGAGIEYSYDHFGTGWGDDAREMRNGDDANIVNGPHSYAIRTGNRGSADRNGNELFVGDGWNTHTFSTFAEANAEVADFFKILLSARGDKNSHTNFLFSPRIALLSNINKNHFIKLIGQRSLRMNTASQNYIENHYQVEPSSEALTGLELIYNVYLADKWRFQMAGYRNNVEVLDFDGSLNESVAIGELELIGTEIELFYNHKYINLVLMYSYTKQLSWEMNNILNKNDISYADYNQEIGNDNIGYYTLRSTGNDINNWPNQAFKAIVDIKPIKWASLHVDSRVHYDFKGSVAGLNALSTAVAESPIESDVTNIRSQLEDAKVYSPDFRLNASITFYIHKNVDLQVYGMNILKSKKSIRYSHASGLDEVAPTNIRFIDEPTAFGAKIFLNF